MAVAVQTLRQFRPLIDAVVVGGGLAGASASSVLAQSGHRVTLIERDAEPAHKICGEFLGGSALHHLGQFGIDVAALGGHAISRMRFLRGAQSVEAALPFPGVGLSRFALDQAMLRHAVAQGVDVVRGVRVSDLSSRGVTTPAGEIEARHVLLATGKHEIRQRPRAMPPKQEDLIGFKMHFRLDRSQRALLEGVVELFLFDDAYVGLQMIEDGRANLCLLADLRRFDAVGGNWTALLADLMAENATLRKRIEDAEPLLPRPLAIHRVPYGYVYSGSDDDGVYRLGDQMAVIPSFAGEGMGIAIATGVAGARAIAKGTSAAQYHAATRRMVTRQVGLATRLYRVGRSRVGQRAMMEAAQHCPGLLRVAATATRVSLS